MSFKDQMPAMLKHEGVWVGTYTYLAPDGTVLDQHSTRVECEFPDSGEYAYIQRNHFTWSDGREYKAVLPGVFRDKKLWWDTETFYGYAWETLDDVVMLNLKRYDDPGAYFVETIVLGDTGQHRSRTWQWFKGGRMIKTTLCSESKVL